MDFGSSALTDISVGLELVTQYMLLAIKLTHVIHTALEEWSGIHHMDAVPATETGQCLLCNTSHTGCRTTNMLLISHVNSYSETPLIRKYEQPCHCFSEGVPTWAC